VLMARRQWHEEWAPRTLLVGSDGSSCSDAAVDLAARIAARHGSQPMLACAGGDRRNRALRRKLAEQASRLSEASGSEVVILRPTGEAHKELPRLGEELRASLIVVGSRGTTGLRALGSVSERVAHGAPCSVLVARGDQ
jgi:nucleotide-binding universal stress UspA family protein